MGASARTSPLAYRMIEMRPTTKMVSNKVYEMVKNHTNLKPLEYLVRVFKRYLYLSSNVQLHATLCGYVANLLPGRPVWLLLVGPPSCGGTTFLSSLNGLPGITSAGDISLGGLLSASSKKDKSKASTGGILMELANRYNGDKWGVLLAKEFNSVLGLDQQEKKKVLNAFREIYDGSWDRNKGVDGGVHLHWQGKAGFLAKCNESIDAERQTMAAMGDRFIYCRFDTTDGFNEAHKALAVNDTDAMAVELNEVVHACLDVILPNHWRDIILSDPSNLFSEELLGSIVTEADKDRIVNLALFAARGRAVVKRHVWGREVENVEPPEGPGRLIGQFKAMYQAGKILGLTYDQCWEMVHSIVWSCLPKARSSVLKSLLEIEKYNHAGVPFKELIAYTDKHHGPVADQTFMTRTVEELVLQRLVDRVDTTKAGSNGHNQGGGNQDVGAGGKVRYKLSKFVKQKLER